ncbi:MAG: hypothetical protein NUK62_09005 [Tenericutes bacterium]|nr:hypothetical protein [Mycoplasmatota bacterium]
MFYTNSPENVLRLGDVLQGYISITPEIKSPLMDVSENEYVIDVNLPQFSVVLDNCCHIGKSTILLSPLTKITAHFWDPPFLANDILQINNRSMPRKITHPQEWNDKISDDDKREYLNADPVFGYKSVFIYEELDEFSPYTIKRDFEYYEASDVITHLPKYVPIRKHFEFQTKRYMVDFKKCFRVNCNDITKENLKESIIDSKLAQLTKERRNELREKLGLFFGEIPTEDQV